MWGLCREIRRKPLMELVEILEKKLDQDEVTFDGSKSRDRNGIKKVGLNLFTRRYIFHLLARLTAATEAGAGRTDSFDKLVNRDVKNPFDIEHIWADTDQELRAACASDQDFDDWRNNVASLLILPADVNRSLQDKPFAEKRKHYSKQNFYAASLDASAYIHQPKFRQFTETQKLPFKPYENFTKVEQSERRELVSALVKQIWSPLRLSESANV
jgi:hypothetical protein